MYTRSLSLLHIHTTGPNVTSSVFEVVDDAHFGLTLLRVNRTHLTVILRNSGTEGGGAGDVPLGWVLDTYTLTAKTSVGTGVEGPKGVVGEARRWVVDAKEG